MLMQVRAKLDKLEEEKQALQGSMQEKLDREMQQSREAMDAAKQKLESLENQLKQSTGNQASKSLAGTQPPAMAAPGMPH